MIEIVAEYVEVETGKGSDALDRRPELKPIEIVLPSSSKAAVASR
jgi:hypothetical protein